MSGMKTIERPCPDCGMPCYATVEVNMENEKGETRARCRRCGRKFKVKTGMRG